MPNLHRIIMLSMLAALISSCGAPVTKLPPTASPTVLPTPESLPPVSIARYPEPAKLAAYHVYDEIPSYDANASNSFSVDLQSADLTKLDLSKSRNALLHANFDSKTRWPVSGKMPSDFDWQAIMETGKDPGLGVRALHAQGMSGDGVGIAIIDLTLLVDHIEYADRLRLYEEPEQRDRGMVARMHGAAVASIALGKTVGVAPEADLYYIAAPLCFENNDFVCLASSVRRIVEVNKTLPASRRIRVLSISSGWGAKDFGYDEITAAVKEASDEGIFVISSSIAETHGLYFQGLGRDPLDDPNHIESYIPGLWWETYFFNGAPENFYYWNPDKRTLLVPMDSRTTASPTGTEDYVFYREGGWSWSIPYLAGVYALAVQVKPGITPNEFWYTALKTGITTQIRNDGKEYELGVILDPQALFPALTNR